MKKLSIANRYFQSENYQAALELYVELAQANPIVAELISANISICKNRLQRQRATALPSPTTAKFKTEFFESLFSTGNLDLVKDKRLPPALHVSKFIRIIQKGVLNPAADEFESILRCGLSSPFQRNLLLFVLRFLPDMSEFHRNFPMKASDSFRYIDILRLVSDRTFWLLERNSFREWLVRLQVFDKRAWNIYFLPPQALSEECSIQKSDTDSSSEYFWDDQFAIPFEEELNKSVAFGTIILNESKFIGLNLLQHYELCDEWVIVEGACLGYPPSRVTSDGFSTDASSMIVELFPDPINKIRLIRHGWTSASGEAAKSELRNRYLERIKSEFLVVIDADEFYIQETFLLALESLHQPSLYAVTLPQIHFWKNTKTFITGGYYDVSHTRFFKVVEGMRYITNHNFPEVSGSFVRDRGHKKYPRNIFDVGGNSFSTDGPVCFHMGFAKDYSDMRDKTDYYINRGERETRKNTTISRAAWFDDLLPEGCITRVWAGDIPQALIFDQIKV